MTTKPEDARLDRRGFLRSIGGVSTVAAVAVAGGALVDDAAAQESADEKKKARYKRTPHVDAFYRTNGYETLKK